MPDDSPLNARARRLQVDAMELECFPVAARPPEITFPGVRSGAGWTVSPSATPIAACR